MFKEGIRGYAVQGCLFATDCGPETERTRKKKAVAINAASCVLGNEHFVLKPAKRHVMSIQTLEPYVLARTSKTKAQNPLRFENS